MSEAIGELPAQGWIPEGDFADRLAQVRSRMGWNYTEAGTECGLDGEAWARWELEGAKPKDYEDACTRISKRTTCNLIWLLTGQRPASSPAPKRIKRKVRREGLEPPTRCLRGIAAVIGIRRRKKPDIVPQYDDRAPYTRPIAA